MRPYHQIKSLSKEHEIVLLSMAEDPVSHVARSEVARFCETVIIVPFSRSRALANAATSLLSRQPLQVGYYRSPRVQATLDATLAGSRFDVVHATLIRLLPYVWSRSQPPVVVDLIDSLTLNLDVRRKQVGGLRRLVYELEYRRVRRYEHDVVRHFPALLVSSEADRKVLDHSGVRVIPTGVDLQKFAFRPVAHHKEMKLVFTGNMSYPPNEEAVLWFAREVWPALRALHPHVRFQVVGANPSKRLYELARSEHSFEVLGRVDDMSEYLAAATLAVCPVLSGSGIQTKVQEALAVGTPVVATSTANRGVQGVPGQHLLVADDPMEFVRAVGSLLSDSELRAKLAHEGRRFVEEHFRWDEHVRCLVEVYRAVANPHG